MQPPILVTILYSATMRCRKERAVFPEHCCFLFSSWLGFCLGCFFGIRVAVVPWKAGAVQGWVRSQACFHGAGELCKGSSGWEMCSTLTITTELFLFHLRCIKKFSLLLVSGSLWQTTGFYLWFLCWFWLGHSLLLCGSSNQISICSVGKCVRHKRDFLCMRTEICSFPLFLKPLAWFFCISKLVSHILSLYICWLSSSFCLP